MLQPLCMLIRMNYGDNCYCEGVRASRERRGTCNVKICVHHERLRKYLDTTYFVVKKQLNRYLKIKDPFNKP